MSGPSLVSRIEVRAYLEGLASARNTSIARGLGYLSALLVSPGDSGRGSCHWLHEGERSALVSRLGMETLERADDL